MPQSGPGDRLAPSAVEVDAEVGQLVDGGRHEEVAASDGRQPAAALEHGHLVADGGEADRSCAPGGPAADDEDVGRRTFGHGAQTTGAAAVGPSGRIRIRRASLRLACRRLASRTLRRRADEGLDLFVGERVLAGLECLEHGRLRRAELLELLGPLLAGRVCATERVALVADDAEDLVVGEATAGRRALLRHHAEAIGQVRATFAVGVAVDLDAGEVVLAGSPVDVAELVFDVREGLEDLPAGERVSDAAATGGAVARGAAAVLLGADAERALDDFWRLGEGADVHEAPHGHEAECGHRPPRDLAALLGSSDVGGVGLRRW